METKASNAKSPLCGTDYIRRTIDSVLETTMGIESEIAMAGCLVSTAVALAKTTAIKTLNIITVPVGKQHQASTILHPLLCPIEQRTEIRVSTTEEKERSSI